jgi:hypothetical protein
MKDAVEIANELCTSMAVCVKKHKTKNFWEDLIACVL